MDSAYFLETLAGNFMDVVQYNGDNRGFEVRIDACQTTSVKHHKTCILDAVTDYFGVNQPIADISCQQLLSLK